MKSLDARQAHARDYVAALAATGRYQFTSSDVRSALGVSADAAKLALNRLARQGVVASPARGFYVIVPPEYRSLACLPPDQFIPALMEQEGRSYYAALLTAAQYHGAAHQRPQAFQVFVDRSRRDLSCGRVRVTFMRRARLDEVPVQSVNTPRGTVRVATPEATAIDLIGYQHQAGGLDHVAQILLELAERIEAEALPTAAETAPITWAQRLGYLLERVDASEKANALRKYVEAQARRSTPLVPGTPHAGSERDEGWRLWINTDLESEP